MARKPGLLTILSKSLTLTTVLVACGTALLLCFVVYGVWLSLKSPVGTATDVGRALFRMEQPRPTGVSPNEADARDIAAAVAIDSEGERVDLLAEARIELIDIHLRAKKRLPSLTYRQIVAKALPWVPDDWKYPRRWQDRDTVITEMGRSESVKELIPIVLARMTSGPGQGCAAKIIRPKWHWAGWAGGEGGAAKIIRTYPKDPRLEGKGFITDFRCMPS